MTTPAVRFAGVYKAFGGPPVLQGVNLDLPARAVSAIVGESGSGKSTLLQLVNGLLRPDRGSVQVAGQPVPETGLAAFRRRIGYAVQGAGLFPHLTVADNITLVARLDGWDRTRRTARLHHLFELTGLDRELGGRFPVQLSGGQQQRVGLCRAMMLEPPLLLLDEPFSAVDPITRVDIHAHFQALTAREPVSVVLVTHDMPEAVKLADHLVILRDGKVLQAGPTPAVLERPANAYVARLLRDQLGTPA